MSEPNPSVIHSSSLKKPKIFKCADHDTNMSKKMQIFYDKEEFFDVVVIAGIDNVKVQAHRIVLCASSDYFLAMFRSTLIDAKVDEIEVKNVDGETLKLLVDFMYTASIELIGETIDRVLRAADFLQMDTLRGACCDFLGEQLDPSNCLGIALFAEQHNFEFLYEKSFVFAQNRFEEVFVETEFPHLTVQQLAKLVYNKDAGRISSLSVLRSLAAWVEHDAANREQFLCNLLSHVCITSFAPKSIMEITKSVCKTIECYKLIHKWLEWHLIPETRSKTSADLAETRNTNQELVFVSDIANFQIQTYNPELDIWSNKEWPHPLKTRESYSMVVINQKLIIAGGEISGYPTDTVECLDLQTLQWTELPPMQFARILPGMAEINGHLYIVGGKIDGQWSKSVEIFDFCLQTWIYSKPLSVALVHIKVAVVNNLLYAVGDNSTGQCYDPVVKDWTAKDHLKENSYYGVAVVNGFLFWANHFREVKRYDPSVNNLTTIESLNLNHLSIKCAFNNRLIFCHLHKAGKSYVRLIKEYYPETGEVKSLAPLLGTSSTSSSRFLTM